MLLPSHDRATRHVLVAITCNVERLLCRCSRGCLLTLVEGSALTPRGLRLLLRASWWGLDIRTPTTRTTGAGSEPARPEPGRCWQLAGPAIVTQRMGFLGFNLKD